MVKEAGCLLVDWHPAAGSRLENFTVTSVFHLRTNKLILSLNFSFWKTRLILSPWYCLYLICKMWMLLKLFWSHNGLCNSNLVIWLVTINLILFPFSTKDQIKNGKQRFSRVPHIYLSDGDFMRLEPANCWMPHSLQLPDGENLIWQRAQLSIFLGLVTTYSVIRMSVHRLPRCLLTEGKERRGKERVSADEQFLRLIGNLDLVWNTRKIICITSKVYLNENSQTRTSPLIFIKLCFKGCGTFFFFFPYCLAGGDPMTLSTFKLMGF